MKAASTIPDNFFLKPELPPISVQWRNADRVSSRRTIRAIPLDSVGDKQEIVCSAILVLSLLTSFSLCILQFASF